jgi:protein-S-isoprenylcysteine O-methyltransferase Ste14
MQRDICKKLVIRNLVWVGATGVLLFVAAGTVRWPAAWVYLAELLVGGLAIGFWLARHDPGLLAERLASLVQQDQKIWDRIFMTTIFVAWHAWQVLMALDAVRFGFSHVPIWLQAVGALAITLSMYIVYLTFRENSFAAPVVKIQKERGQTVVTTGPYRHVRHPMYAGALFFFLGAPLLLGSWYGLALVPVLIAMLAFRTVMEERMLTAELEGYREYAARVRYRFIPMVW